MAKKWFSIAREGATIDGRRLTAGMLNSMANNYDPNIYGARINKEHIRGLFYEDQFGAFGDVIALKAEKDDTGKVRLYAQLDPTDDLVSMNKKRQKVYTSIEVGEVEELEGAYLIGLAVTDSPASTGTSMLSFSAGQNQSVKFNMKDGSGQYKEVTFKAAKGDLAEYHETTMDFSDSKGEGPSLFSKVKSMLGKHQNNNDNAFSDVHSAVEVIAQSQSELLENIEGNDFSSDIEQLQSQYLELKTQHSELLSKLESEESGSYTPRPISSGGSSELTDC